MKCVARFIFWFVNFVLLATNCRKNYVHFLSVHFPLMQVSIVKETRLTSTRYETEESEILTSTIHLSYTMHLA